MADRLYLSLWYPNFRLEALPAALAGVLHQFSLVGGKRVAAASAYPINFTEPPTYQRIYVDSGVDSSLDTSASPPEINPATGASDQAIDEAVSEATEQLHDDMAYEFEMRWQLWSIEDPSAAPSRHALSPGADPYPAKLSEDDDGFDDPEFNGTDSGDPGEDDPDTLWKLRPHTVRILGFGPQFDVAGYEQNGHLLVDFGLDTPWVLDNIGDEPLDEEDQIHIQQNVEKLLAFTLLIEKNCGISSRLLWTESGEPLAEKLIARLQRVH